MKNFLLNSTLTCILVCSINFINAQQTVNIATVTGQLSNRVNEIASLSSQRKPPKVVLKSV